MGKNNDILKLRELLKKRNEYDLSNLLKDSRSEIYDTMQVGNYWNSIICSFRIYLPYKKYEKLKNISENEKNILLESILKIYPYKSEAPEIVDIEFYLDDKSILEEKVDDNIDIARFLISLKTYFDILIDSGDLKSTFWAGEEPGLMFLDTDKFYQKLQEEVGVTDFDNIPTFKVLFETISFFFNELPKKPDSSGNSLRYNFTININKKFKKFNIPANLSKGIVFCKDEDINEYTIDDNKKILKEDKKSKIQDIFICYASKDKNEIITPLVQALKREKITYWIDEGEIKWGDSLTQKINNGLKSSKYVLVMVIGKIK